MLPLVSLAIARKSHSVSVWQGSWQRKLKANKAKKTPHIFHPKNALDCVDSLHSKKT